MRCRPSTYVFRLGDPFQIKTSPWGIDVLRMFPLISLVAIQKLGRLEREVVRVVSQPELDLAQRVAPTRDVDADHEEDQREGDQPAAGRPDRPQPSQPAFGSEPIVIPLLAVGADHRGEDDRE